LRAHAHADGVLEGSSAVSWAIAADQGPGLAPGDPADPVLLPGNSVAAAVMDCPHDRTVVHHGRVVAVDGQLR
jgi:cytosine deaminase